jgi:hypothetical protein
VSEGSFFVVHYIEFEATGTISEVELRGIGEEIAMPTSVAMLKWTPQGLQTT